MNICIISTDASQNGGIARFARQTNEIFPSAKLHYFTRETRKNAGKLWGYPPFYVFNPIRLVRVLNNSNTRVVFLNDPQCTSITWLTCIIAAIWGFKVVFFSHGFMFHHNAGILKRSYFRFVISTIFRIVNVVSVGPNDTMTLRNFGFTDFVEIRLGVKPLAADSKMIGNSNGSRDIDFLLVGRNSQNKNLNMVEDFLALYPNKNVKIAIVTDQIEVSREITVYSNLSDEELSLLYAGSKYFISFSSYEGFGLSAIEAVRHGAIPICYANSSFSQIFSDYPFFFGRQP